MPKWSKDKAILSLASVDNLNQLTSSQVCLLLLRALNTSDLTFMYSLFKPETIRDIENECSHLLALDIQDHESHSGLSPEEISEYNDHLMTLHGFALQHENDPNK